MQRAKPLDLMGDGDGDGARVFFRRVVRATRARAVAILAFAVAGTVAGCKPRAFNASERRGGSAPKFVLLDKVRAPTYSILPALFRSPELHVCVSNDGFDLRTGEMRAPLPQSLLTRSSPGNGAAGIVLEIQEKDELARMQNDAFAQLSEVVASWGTAIESHPRWPHGKSALKIKRVASEPYETNVPVFADGKSTDRVIKGTRCPLRIPDASLAYVKLTLKLDPKASSHVEATDAERIIEIALDQDVRFFVRAPSGQSAGTQWETGQATPGWPRALTRDFMMRKEFFYPVLLHEFGHVLGLADAYEPPKRTPFGWGATKHPPSIMRGGQGSEASPLTLAPSSDDVNGVHTLIAWLVEGRTPSCPAQHVMKKRGDGPAGTFDLVCLPKAGAASPARAEAATVLEPVTGADTVQGAFPGFAIAVSPRRCTFTATAPGAPAAP